MQTDNKLKWDDIIFTIKYILMVSVIMIPVLLTVTHSWGVIFPEQMKELESWKEQQDIENQRIADMVMNYDSIARTSISCDELKQVQLDLLGYGVNAHSWFPRMSDKAMKVAQERYGVLCR